MTARILMSDSIPNSGPDTCPVPVLADIGPLIDSYDGVILDLWGVVHDGRTPYPGSKSTLAQMMLAGKKVVMLSNAPRRAEAVIGGMTAMGLERALYSDAPSSSTRAPGATKKRLLITKACWLVLPVSLCR
jgi:ribonucleotide monophosphatase NagD (HAD superfamily)